MKNIDIIKNSDINLLSIIISELTNPFQNDKYNYCLFCKDRKCLKDGCDITYKAKVIKKWLKRESL